MLPGRPPGAPQAVRVRSAPPRGSSVSLWLAFLLLVLLLGCCPGIGFIQSSLREKAVSG